MIRGTEAKLKVKRLSDGREAAVTVFTDDVERFSDGDFTFVRVTLQNDMPGVELFRELSPGQSVSIRLELGERGALWAFDSAMVATKSVTYWCEDDADVVRSALELASDYDGPFGVSFIVPL